MAEKEERIFITTIDRAEDIDEFCVYGRDCMKRTESIECMAKAIYENIYIAGCENPTSSPLYDTADERTQYQYRDIAAHALDALLEGK